MCREGIRADTVRTGGAAFPLSLDGKPWTRCDRCADKLSSSAPCPNILLYQAPCSRSRHLVLLQGADIAVCFKDWRRESASRLHGM